MILVRHGQSEFNVHYNRTRIDPGIEDPALTEVGRQQAAAAAEQLAREGVRRLLVSPYRRTLETAEVIAAALDLPIEIEPLLRERMAFTCDIGSVRSLLTQRWPHLRFDHVEEQWWPSEEETEDRLVLRCRRFHRAAREMADWRSVAAITHWGFVRGLTGRELRNGELLRFDPHLQPLPDDEPAAPARGAG
jgi:broad specificity phosphatase PhoE